ncbi:hypothetical protein SUGI_0815800 [Cryptomeria japonica]|uniref:GRAS family protein RAM1 n=1 Tax=Cryptomeria japonica TaxID=3369 RepID=UPI0024149842|nr:GRAS family protein RAM1 [Cryptomeria japonica]GLJ39892.1 hypothetical protein SUGI_0815800 [Cryptomeria japonica]
MALISDGYELIDYFQRGGEPIARLQISRPKRPFLELNESGSSPSSSEQDWREGKKSKHVKALRGDEENFYENYRAPNLFVPTTKDKRDLLVKQSRNLVQQKKKVVKEAERSPGLQLICLLLNCASSIAENKKDMAENLLRRLYSRVSKSGNSIERVAAHFAEALSAKLKSPTPLFKNRVVAGDPDQLQSEAHIAFYRVSPFYQFAHLTANQAIIEAFEGKKKLHIVDFDISHGIQWSSLIQSLSEEEDVPSLRISGFGRDVNVLKATGIRLTGFAHSCGLTSFEFHPFLEDTSKGISIESLQIKEDETVAVNLVLYLNKLASSQTLLCSRLRSIESLRPKIVVVVEHEASQSPTTFLSRFMESLHYYAALFDSMDECLPLQSAERLRIETFHLGEQIKNSIRDDGVGKMMGRRETHDKWETWKGRMERGGFAQVGFSSRSVSQAKLLLQSRQHCSSFEGGGGFKLLQKDLGRTLSLAWQDRQLILASVWRCKD